MCYYFFIDVGVGFAVGVLAALFARYFIDGSKCSVYDSDRIHEIQMSRFLKLFNFFLYIINE